jgi:hypothetical protein
MRRVLITIAVVVGIPAIFVAATFRGRQVKRKTDVATIEKDIHDHVPIGSPRAGVEACLDQRKIGHSYVGILRGLPHYEYSHTEMAMIRDVWAKGIFRSDIQILFKFDDSDSKLVKYTVQEIVTGPQVKLLDSPYLSWYFTSWVRVRILLARGTFLAAAFLPSSSEPRTPSLVLAEAPARLSHLTSGRQLQPAGSILWVAL